MAAEQQSYAKILLPVALVPIISIIGVVLFSTSEGIMITPKFEAEFEKSLEKITLLPGFEITYSGTGQESNNFETVTIKNTGWRQAKDVNIFLILASETKLIDFTCPEGEIESNLEPIETFAGNVTRAKLKMDKFSVNVDCVIAVQNLDYTIQPGNDAHLFKSVVVTADKAPGYQWTEETGVLDTFSAFESVVTLIALIMGIASAIFGYIFKKSKFTITIPDEFTGIKKD